MGKWLLAHGDGRVGVTDGFVLFVGPGPNTNLADRASTAASPLDALDILFASGIAAAPDFCLVTVADGHGTAFLRGDLTLRMEAHWGDAVVEHGSAVRSHREFSAQGVSRFAIFAGSMRDHADTPIRRLQALTVPADGGMHGASLLIWEETDVADTELITSPPAPVADREQQPGDTVEFPNLYDELFGATMHTNIERAAVRRVADDDDDAPAWELHLPGGETVRIDVAAVIGRRPAAYPLTDPESTTLVEIPDPQGNISRSHVYLFVSQGRIFVQDLGSTNGTVLLRDGAPSPLQPDAPVEAFDRDALVLGGDARVHLRRAHERR